MKRDFLIQVYERDDFSNTFQIYKNRKHNPHTLIDFKAEVVAVVARLQQSDFS